MSGPQSKTSARRIAARERERQAVELRKAGASYEAIARQIGYTSRGAAYEAVKRALLELNAETKEEAAELRRLDLERLDALLLALWRQAKDGNHGAIDRVLRILERRAKMLGLDAPSTMHQFTIDLSTLTDEQIEQIAAGDDLTQVFR